MAADFVQPELIMRLNHPFVGASSFSSYPPFRLLLVGGCARGSGVTCRVRVVHQPGALVTSRSTPIATSVPHVLFFHW